MNFIRTYNINYYGLGTSMMRCPWKDEKKDEKKDEVWSHAQGKMVKCTTGTPIGNKRDKNRRKRKKKRNHQRK